KGYVWRSIVENVGTPGTANDYISVADLSRDRLARHPWSLSGGGAVELKAQIDRGGRTTMGSASISIGFMALTREDDAYFMPPHAPRQLSLSSPHVKWVGDGISVRDWYAAPVELTLFPYTQDGAKAYAAQSAMRRLWKYRRHLEVR